MAGRDGKDETMAPRYIFHVGPMKTASTYLQQCLVEVQDALKERGVTYPKEFIDPGNQHNHFPMYQAMVQKRYESLRPIFAKINAENEGTVLISCEQMTFLRRDEMAILRDLIGTPDIQIVSFVRRWSDRISSLWNQSLLMGSSQTLPEFYLGLLDGRSPEYYRPALGPRAGAIDVDYSLPWRDHETVFGRAAVRLFPYSTVQDSKSDVFTRFCTDVLGLTDLPAPNFLGDKRWASMARDEAEILRALNGMFFREHGAKTVEVRNMIMWKRVVIDKEFFAAAIEGEGAELAINDNAVHFEAPYRNMAEFADCVVAGPGVEAGEIFTRKTRQNSYARQGWLTDAGMADGLRALYDQIKAEIAKPA